MSVKCGHCHNHHETVAGVKLCSQRPVYTERYPGESPAMAATSVRNAYVNRYAEDGHVPDNMRNVTAKDVSDARERMFSTVQSTESVPTQRTKQRATEGMYRKSGTIYKVQVSPKSGRSYAKRLVELVGHKDSRTGKNKWRFEYAPGFVYELRSEHRLSEEQAKEFGALYGTCCVCGRTLTNEESISLGIGPICREKMFS